MGSYIPSTREERLSMLESIGMHSFDELYADIPEDLRLKDGLSLPSGLSELEVARKIEEISGKNPFSSYFQRCRILSPLYSGYCKASHFKRRICHCIHSLSGRDQPGTSAVDL